MPLSSEYRIDVLQAYQALVECLNHLKQALALDEQLVAWTQDLPTLLSPIASVSSFRDKAFCILRQLEYLNNQEPREILVCAGFVGASVQTLDSVQALNLSKERFKVAILNLKKGQISLKDKSLNREFDSLLNQRPLSTSNALNRMGLARLHLKQCYRKIPVLHHAPKKISWTWAHTRSIKRISVEQAKTMLLKKQQDQGIQRQLNQVCSLNSQEPLAIVQELAPHLRANILLPDEAGAKNRLMVKGPVPIFFPADTSTPAPLFKPPNEKQNKNANRLIRKDVQLDPEPFLPAIRVHRYYENK